jgi:DNA repair protein RadC
MPAEVHAVLDALALMLRPVHREHVKSPHDIAAVFMLEMAHLDQEQLRVACLNTRNRLQKIHLVYQGSLNASMIRVGEIYKEPLRLNSAAIIIAHNHPSGEPEPSPEDVLVTQEIVAAGKLLDVQCLDHLVIGQGRWLSLRECGLGFHD